MDPKTSCSKRRQRRLKDNAVKYAPWIARKIPETLGVVISLLALGSDLAERFVKWLVIRAKETGIEAVLASEDAEVDRKTDISGGTMIGL